MDILVMLEEDPEHSPVLAHVNSVPAPLNSERRSRDVVTLYGVPSPESLALALAATVEAHRPPNERSDTIRHLGIWPERGAIGDAAWRDVETGQLMTRDLDIPLEVLLATANQLLVESGQLIRRLVAGLLMPDWPEGARRAISFTFAPVAALSGFGSQGIDAVLESLRESNGMTYDFEGD
jgi:hypothetical protein